MPVSAYLVSGLEHLGRVSEGLAASLQRVVEQVVGGQGKASPRGTSFLGSWAAAPKEEKSMFSFWSS